MFQDRSGFKAQHAASLPYHLPPHHIGMASQVVLVDDSDKWLSALLRDVRLILMDFPKEIVVARVRMIAIFACAHMGGAQAPLCSLRACL